MQLSESFDINTLPQDTGGGDFSPIPDGVYTCRIVSCVETPNKAGTGSYLKTRFDVVGPTHQGRVLWANLNIRNTSAKAEEIGRQQLRSIMAAAGVERLSNTDQLIGAELNCKVVIRQDETYGAGNEIKGFSAVATSKAPMTTAAPTPAAGAAPAKATPPWAKK